MLYEGFSTSGLFFEKGGEVDPASKNVLVDSHRVFIVEGVDPRMHFVHQNAQCPPIHCFSMALVQDDLRSDALGSATNRECSAFVEDLRESEVDKLQIAITSDDKVFGFYISINDILVMQDSKQRTTLAA